MRTFLVWLFLIGLLAAFWEVAGRFSTLRPVWVATLPAAAFGAAFSRLVNHRNWFFYVLLMVGSLLHPLFGEHRRAAYDSLVSVDQGGKPIPKEAADAIARMQFNRRLADWQCIAGVVVSVAFGLLATRGKRNSKMMLTNLQ